ncbi:GNAT family N-acetyltransferase [Thermoflavimicrobium daqui]|uniref:GNAT family N-acetyltransferase n=1 Tax=Thermoflavimicrobium daqui TaxID=2137476 RepID=A0A364K1S1_9BACL|nr:GNAT family N-acetyltransferase [Thermoflavimicrobium daqui]
MEEIQIRPCNTQADRDWLIQLWQREWGGTTMVTCGVSHSLTDLEAFIAWEKNERVGAVTYRKDEDEAELMSINAIVKGKGIGSKLLQVLEEKLGKQGYRKLWLITTNDNLDALRFYQCRGYRFVSIYPGAVDEARKVKQTIPLIGEYGIPLHDELKLEKVIDDDYTRERDLKI